LRTNPNNAIHSAAARRNAIKKITLVLTIIILVLLFTVRTHAQAQTQPSALQAVGHVSQSPASVIVSFEAALNSHDSAATLALFADGAVVSDLSNIACLPGPPPICPEYVNVFTTKTQIRGWLEQLVKVNVQLKETGTFQETGNNVTWSLDVSVDEYRRLGVAPLSANANAIVEEGKIRLLNIALSVESMSKLAAAYRATRASPYSILATGIAFGIILIGLVFPAAAVYYISRVERLFSTVPGLRKPWVLLQAGVVSLFIAILLIGIESSADGLVPLIDMIQYMAVVFTGFFIFLSMLWMREVWSAAPSD